MLEESYKPYYNIVKDRCSKLIDMRIWDGIDKNKLDAWLNNFQNEKEKLFAACILDSFIFRSEQQTLSLLYDLLSRDLGNLFRLDNVVLEDDPLTLLRNKYKDPGFRIVAAVKATDGPSKSANSMTNLIVHQLFVVEKWVITPQTIPLELGKGINKFVLLDDIICSGNQIKETIDEWKLFDIDTSFYVAVCVAHQKGLEYLNESFPKIKIAYSEYINIEDSFFKSIDSKDFDFKSEEEFIEFYSEFMKERKVINKKILGYGDLGMLYAFKHNVPNNCMPIIHYNNDMFKSLMDKKK